MAVHASVLLKTFLESGKPVVTTRELAREGGMTVAEAQQALLSEAACDGALTADNEAPYEFQFTVTFRPAAVDGSTMLVVKRFRSRQDAEACVAQGEGRSMMLHSIAAKSLVQSMTMCQIMEKRSNSSLSSFSHKLQQRQSYPLLSRQATIEKSLSSGELVAQSLDSEERGSAVPSAKPVRSSDNKTKDTGAVDKAVTDLPSAPVAGVAGELTPTATIPPTTVASTAPPLQAETRTLSASLASEERPSTAVQAPTPSNEPSDAPQKPRSLLDMLRVPTTKRARTEDGKEEGVPPHGAAVTKAPPPSAPKAPSAAKGKGRPPKETKSLAKLAARNAGKPAASIAGVASSLVLDEEVADSDEERNDDDAKKYLVEMRSNSPPAKRGRPRRQMPTADLIPCEEDSSADVEDVPEEEFVLCDAATLAREPQITLPAPQQQQPPALHSPARPRIAVQKRPREAAPPAALSGNLNSFFNADLIAFQKQYTKEHRTECQNINGEFFFNDVVFFRHNESTEELSEDEYNAKQRDLVQAFEEEKAAKKAAAAIETTEPASESLTQPKPAVPASPKAPKETAPSKTKAAAAPAKAPQKTLFSYFAKKS